MMGRGTSDGGGEDTTQAWNTLTNEIVRCRRCARLVAWREKVAEEKRRAFMDWEYWGRPVPGYGDRSARLLIIGLAPAAHGANRTGRMFTGDSSGNTLAEAMHRAGFANQAASVDREDGLLLQGAFLTAVGRCAPPKNKPAADELRNCREYLRREIELLPSVEVVMVLGKFAFDGYLEVLRECGVDLPSLKFTHGAWFEFDPPLPQLAVSYHPSRQNTQTGRLTREMFDEVFSRIRRYIQESERAR
jgi:uracil-DNA glycosylase family 4